MKASMASQQIGAGSYDLCAPEARKFILIAAILASSLGFIDGSMVAIALPAIRETLGANLVQAQWVSNAYLLTLSSLILVGGAAGDRFGLARVFFFGISLFVVSSMGCAVATEPGLLIGARAIQGIGAALMVPGSLALISRAYPKSERGYAIGIWAAASAVTSALGPIIGGLAMTLGGEDAWRWIFAINLPLGGLALFLIWSKVKQDPAQPEKGLDVPGALLAVLGLGLFAWALTGAEPSNPIDENTVIYAAVGLVAFAMFLMVEANSKAPMMPLVLFNNVRFSAANAIAFLVYFSFSAILFYLPMTVIGGWGVSEIETAAAFAPLSVFIAALSRLAGKLADRYGPTPLLFGGSLILAAGYGALGVVVHTENYWGAIMPAMCLQGIGMGLVVAPMSTAVMGSVESHETGIASGINNAVTRMAGLIAVAAMGSAVALAYAYTGGGQSFGTLNSDVQSHRDATNAAFATVAWTASLMCVIASGISLLTKKTAPADTPEA